MAGESSEATTEAAPAPEVADAQSAVPALDEAGPVAVPRGPVSAPHAARMLAGGGRGGVMPPKSRPRLTPDAALALQRSVGNRALSQRILMRQQPAKDPQPLMPPVGTAQDIADWAATEIGGKHRDKLLVLDLERREIWVFNDAITPVAVKRLNLKVYKHDTVLAWQGVTRWFKDAGYGFPDLLFDNGRWHMFTVTSTPEDLTLNADDANQVAPEQGQHVFAIFPPKGSVIDPDKNPYQTTVTGKKEREKDWAIHDVVKARTRINGDKKNPPKTTDKRPAPTQLVPWTKDGRWYLNVWLGGDHRTLELDPDQSTDDLVERILKQTEQLKAEDDPRRSTRVQGTKPGPPKFTGPRQPYESERPLPGHPTLGEYVAAKSPFTDPGFPAKIISHGAEGSAGHEGAEITVTGASVGFTMQLNFGAVTDSFTAALLGSHFGGINYKWEIFDISKVTLGQLKGALGKPTPQLESELETLKQQLADEPDEGKRKDAEAQIAGLQQELDKRGKDPDSGRLADIGRDWANTWEDTKEDLTSVPMFIPGVNIAWIGLIAVSDIVQLVGAPIKALFGFLSAPSHDKSIEFPSEGTFLIRCTAWQDVTERDVEYFHRHGWGEPAYRPPSVAYIAVRVTPINQRATEVNDAELTAIESLKKVIELTPDEDERADYQAQLKEAQEALADNNPQAIERARRTAQQEVDNAKEWRKLQLEDVPLDKIETKLLKWKARLDLRGLSVDEWQTAQEEAVKQLVETYQRVSTYGLEGCDTSKIYRPRVTLVSEVDGQVYPIVANLVQENGSTVGARRWRLIDVTSKDTKRVYKGSGATHNDAINDAFRDFKWRAAYGRGTIAIRLPEQVKEIDGEQISVPAQMRAQPGFGERIEERLSDLAVAAEVASLFIAGPIGAGIGIAGGLIGAGLAIKNIITRIEAGKPVLSWETAMDAFAVVTAFTFAGQAMRKSARLAALADRAKWVGQTVHVLSTAGQVIIIPIQTYSELQQISDEEAAALKAAGGDSSKVDHGRYNARRMMAWARAVKSGAVMVRMTQMASNPELGWDPLKKKGAHAGKPVGRPGEQPPTEIKPPTAGQPAAGEPHPGTAGGGPVPIGGDKPPATPVHTTPAPTVPHDPYHAARQQGAVAPGSGEAVIKAAGDWKLELRQMVDKFDPAQKSEAAQELSETRRKALDNEYSKADAAHGCVPFDVGTVAFDSDIDATMIPKEALSDHTGPRRPVNEQISAAADAAQQVINGLRQRFGGDPDTVLDVAIHAYVGEDLKPQYKTPAEEAAARAHDTAVSWAEMRRGMTREEWLQLEADYKARLDRPDAHPSEHQMLEQIRQQMVEGFRFKQRMDDLMLEMVGKIVVESKGKLTGQQAEPLARDRILLDKRRQLAEAFKGYPDVDWVAIKKLQVEIRWFAPGAYASESAFAYAVKYGQVRKEAGKAAAKASGAGQPTTSQVLDELNPNLDEERWVSPAERSSRLANVANANIGELGRHPHGAEPKAQAKDAAKYAGRVLEAAETMGGPVRHGPIEDALRLFKQSKWPDGTPELRDRAVARWADQAIDGKGVTHNSDGSVTITNETYTAFAEAAKEWMRKTAIDARITERSMADRTDVPDRPTPTPKPGAPAPPPATPVLDAAGLSAEARTRVLAAMPPETANAIAGWIGKERLESISKSPDRLKELVEAHQRVLPALTDPLAVAGLRRLTEINPKLPGSQNALGDAKMLDAIMGANPDNLALALRVLGRPDMQTPGLHPQRSKNALGDLSRDITRLTAIDKFGPAAYDEIARNRAVRIALEEKVEGLGDPTARASAIQEILSAESTAQRRRLLGLPGPKRRSRSLEVKPDKSDPQAWKEYQDDALAFIKDPEHAKSINPLTDEPYSAMTEQQLEKFVEARATLLQIKDRFADPARYKQFQKLSQVQKLRILDQMDDLAEVAGVRSQWNPRARVAEALFVPGGGFGQKSFRNKVFPSASGGTGWTRLDGKFGPGERRNGPVDDTNRPALNPSQTEWIEFKSNKTLTEGLAEKHAEEGFQDWHALLGDDKLKADGLVIWYAREPSPAVKAKMEAKLLGPDSPFRAVRFGDGDWKARDPTVDMPPSRPIPPG
ncbi:MAG: hypothetical protein ACXVHX_01080 [Solirubrobacteraceae bacterium]